MIENLFLHIDRRMIFTFDNNFSLTKQVRAVAGNSRQNTHNRTNKSFK